VRWWLRKYGRRRVRGGKEWEEGGDREIASAAARQRSRARVAIARDAIGEAVGTRFSSVLFIFTDTKRLTETLGVTLRKVYIHHFAFG
jgi:hypothetical protein